MFAALKITKHFLVPGFLAKGRKKPILIIFFKMF